MLGKTWIHKLYNGKFNQKRVEIIKHVNEFEGKGKKMEWKIGGHLSQIWILIVLLLDSQQNCGVPLIESRNAVVIFDCICESFNVGFL